MQNAFENFIGAEIHMNLLFLIGIAMFIGTIGARIFQKLRIPQVVGFIITGLIVGEFGLNIISSTALEQLIPMNYFALGIIGFMIGGELKADIFRKYGKQFLALVFAEGIGAFIFVAPLVAIIVWFFTKDIQTTIVLSLIIGAISSATDPASTMQVFWEYRTKGILTTAIIAVVALDDALALALYAIASGIANLFAGNAEITVSSALEHFAYEICGAIFLGVIFGLVLGYTYNFVKKPERLLPYTLGLILLTIGLAQALQLDIILASMAFGVTLVNLVPRQSQETFDLVQKFAPPIYVLFFVFVGARLTISKVSLLVGCLIAAYVVARSIGKMLGIYCAAKWSHAHEKVQRYAGMCLFAQAGVAVGLSIMASQHFSKEIGDIIITVITATTFIVQLIGPAFVKYAATRAKEVDLNITEEDLIEMFFVKDVMNEHPVVLQQKTPLKEIIEKFSLYDDTVYYVVDKEKNIIGSVSLEGIRTTLSTGLLTDMLIADDVINQTFRKVTPQTKLSDAMVIMHKYDYDYLPIVEKEESNHLIGVLDKISVRRMINSELLHREKLAE